MVSPPTIDLLDADRLGVEPERATGQVVALLGRLAGDRVGVEHDEVGVRALGDATAVAQAEQVGRDAGHLAHRLLEREQRPVAHELAEHDRRVVGVAHDVDVRAGVGPAEHDALVAPDLAPGLPALVGHAHGRHQRREHDGEGQPVGDHDVEEHVDRVGAALGGDVGDAPTVGELDQIPLHHAGDALRAGGVETGAQRSRTAGSATRAATFGVGERDHLAPAGHALEHAAARGAASRRAARARRPWRRARRRGRTT